MKAYFFIVLMSLFLSLSGQGVYIYDGQRTSRTIDLLDIRYESSLPFFTSIKNQNSQILLQALDEKYNDLSPFDQSNAIKILQQYHYFRTPLIPSTKITADSLFHHRKNPEELEFKIIKNEGIGKYFYKNKYHFYAIETENFSLHVDPIMDIQFSNASNRDDILYQNTRGARISGYVDKKVYFYSEILENQASFPTYVNEYIQENKAIPGNGFYKSFKSNFIKSKPAYDYLNACGYLGIPISPNISLDIGHGRHFIGDGKRSLLLSDFSNNYFYLKLNTKIWKLNYQNIFAELAALGSSDIRGDVLLTKKYFAGHYLSFKPFRTVEVGLFESVIFNRADHFEFQYLNPLILYRSVEHLIGSPDNAMLGLNISWDLFKTAKFYGQVVIDEFRLSQLNTGWWGNKYGGQLGLKYFNLFKKEGLDLRIEANFVRPFTYAQSRPIDIRPDLSITSYSHYKQALAHPLGANFEEYILSIQTPILNWLFAEFYWFHYVKGTDRIGGPNYGSNILRLTTDYEKEYDNFIGQGDKDKVNLMQLRLSAEIFPDVNVDLHSTYRSSSLKDRIEFITNLGLRYNINPTNFHF